MKNLGWYLLLTILTISCDRTSDLVDFTIEDEMLLGEKLSEIISTSGDYQVIPEASNAIIYAYVNTRLEEIITADTLEREDLIWSVTLLDNEDRSAFALPGGYIYINTGLIFFLENEDQFSGLIAHLIAHIDKSHVSERLFFEFGINNLKRITNSGSEEDLQEVLSKLDLQSGEPLTYSRSNEQEADVHSVYLMIQNEQACNASSLFFQRMLNVQPDQQQVFLNVHLGDDQRVSTMNELASTISCNTTVDDESAIRYQTFRNSIP